MRVPQVVARINKYVTNPIQGIWAPRVAPWAVVEHVGRTSGKAYSNPVLCWVDHGRVSIPLTYGTQSDWVRNVLAAGEFTLVREGERVHVAGARILPPDSPDIVGLARYVGRPFEGVLFGRIVEQPS
ncbi:nitroreductase family deazaflavin-dependent oxidoreductase [Gordonia alkaliphila]|uniref:Nitroreductase family deazaflavin-dependent oxidoreductase n=1 Tax=Gordonia alkaliphila TaxID=1053547 RepID=A0ABP8Z744_9ACTN|nr:nitroreductase family deazaflavin-dependent oxidoreductase [Gordonia alkaliphila]MCK0440079.1 nitroreductase family deazaflavin-dependent oxidoreductase [Gordonia alkaliphila]